MTALLSPPRFAVGNKYQPVKIEDALLTDIKVLADFHGKKAQAWLSELLRPIIHEEIVKMHAALGLRIERSRDTDRGQSGKGKR